MLANSIRCKRRPRLRFKDIIKRYLEDFNIDQSGWLNLSVDRQNWRQALRNGRSHDSHTNLEKLRAKRSILNFLFNSNSNYLHKYLLLIKINTINET